jgi:hypothetical protein
VPGIDKVRGARSAAAAAGSGGGDFFRKRKEPLQAGFFLLSFKSGDAIMAEDRYG